MNLDDLEYNFIDEIYKYEGLWERKSSCGLKIVRKPNTSMYLAEQGTPCAQGLALSGMILY